LQRVEETEGTVKIPFFLHKLLYCSTFGALIAFACIAFASICNASTPQDEYKKIQKDIKIQKQKIEAAKRRESSILTDIENTNKQLNKVERDLRKYRSSLAVTESKIAAVENEIFRNRRAIEKMREWIKRKLRVMHKSGTNKEIVMLFMSADDISHVMRAGKYLQLIAAYEHGLLETYKDTLESLIENEKQLISLKKQLIVNREKVQREENALSQKKSQRENLLASVKREKSANARMLREMESSSRELLEIIRESERAQKEKEETFSSGTFASLKGKLPWPADGKIAIRYGSQKDPQFNTPIFRSGTYIESNRDAVARAVHAGKVVFAEWFKGYGQLVIVNHGNGYHTLYGSLSEIFTKVGDIIKGKQPVGRVGSSGIVNSPGLYFELRFKGKPLDPMQWLHKR
jgi:murein hydrolase activator